MAARTDSNDETIPLARPAMTDVEVRAAERVLRSGWLVLGPENRRFEARLAEYTGRRHAVAVTSGSVALELSLWAQAESDWPGLAVRRSIGTASDWRDVGRDRPPEVLVPAAGFPAAVNAAVRMGAKVVAVDIDPATWTMDMAQAARAVTDATWALVSIDMFGQVAESRPICELAERAGIHVIDDAACSLGGFDASGVAGGGYGALATLSFHPRKVMTTGEGGAILCDDDELAACLRQLRNQGQAGRGVFARAGTNARLGEIAAAIGSAQLDRMPAMLRERRLLVRGYHERLASLRARELFDWQTWHEDAQPAHQTFAVILAENLPGGTTRAQVQAKMRERAIETGVAGFSLNRLQVCAREMPDIARGRFPVAEAMDERGLALPLFSGMRSADLDRVADALAEALS